MHKINCVNSFGDNRLAQFQVCVEYKLLLKFKNFTFPEG